MLLSLRQETIHLTNDPTPSPRDLHIYPSRLTGAPGPESSARMQARTLYTQTEADVGWAWGEAVKARSRPMAK